MKASPSRPFILGVTKPSQKDAPCQVAKPHQSNGQLKPSSLPSSKPQLFPRPSSASIAGKRAFTLTRSSSGRWSPCRASSAVQSRTRPYANKLAATNRKYCIYSEVCQRIGVEGYTKQTVSKHTALQCSELNSSLF